MCAWGAASADRLLESPPPLPSAAPPSTASPSNLPPPPTRLPFSRRRRRRSTPTSSHDRGVRCASPPSPACNCAGCRAGGCGCGTSDMTVRAGPAGEGGARREWGCRSGRVGAFAAGGRVAGAHGRWGDMRTGEVKGHERDESILGAEGGGLRLAFPLPSCIHPPPSSFTSHLHRKRVLKCFAPPLHVIVRRLPAGRYCRAISIRRRRRVTSPARLALRSRSCGGADALHAFLFVDYWNRRDGRRTADSEAVICSVMREGGYFAYSTTRHTQSIHCTLLQCSLSVTYRNVTNLF
ncbi:hypothetical protein B0H14DRAFT_640127, partial [Mycena olivaceomarginata]